MRLAYGYIDVPVGEQARSGLPASADEFHAHVGYDSIRLTEREDFFAYANQDWMVELREVLRELLDRDRSVLSVGSGKGEHEVPLFLEGYDVTASDVTLRALDDARSLFPGFKAIELDVLDPPAGHKYDDVLATGIDYALDDSELERFLRNARSLVGSDGRVIVVLRYHDNLVTRVIDRLLIPTWARVRGARYRRAGQATEVVRREHGYRRTRAELAALGGRCGFDVGRVRYAAFGLELERVPFPRPLLRLARRVDRRLHVFNSATVFELKLR